MYQGVLPGSQVRMVGSRVGPGRKIRLDSCLSDGMKVQTFNEKALCRGWSMRPNLSSNIGFIQELPAEFGCLSADCEAVD